MNKIKIYGERNTGTNYLTKLIRDNFNIKILPGVAPNLIITAENFLHTGELLKDLYFKYTFFNNLGWKHSMVKPVELLNKHKLANKIFFITITKNPYSWLLSLYKNPYHYKGITGSFESFLNSPYRNVKRENTGLKMEYPTRLWNIKNNSYIKLNGNFQVINLKYEDLLTDPSKVLKKIQTIFSLKHTDKEFMNYEKSTKGAETDFSSYQDYYLKEKWRDNENFTKTAIKIINSMLDDKVLEYFGYIKL